MPVGTQAMNDSVTVTSSPVVALTIGIVLAYLNIKKLDVRDAFLSYGGTTLVGGVTLFERRVLSTTAPTQDNVIMQPIVSKVLSPRGSEAVTATGELIDECLDGCQGGPGRGVDEGSSLPVSMAGGSQGHPQSRT